jgi:hypothetical protein
MGEGEVQGRGTRWRQNINEGRRVRNNGVRREERDK